MTALEAVALSVNLAFLGYFVLHNTIQLIIVFVSVGEVRRRVRGQRTEDLDFIQASPFTPPLSILLPAYNEEKTIVESLTSMAKLRFPRKEIIVINDGSTDATLQTIVDTFGFERVETTYEARITTQPVRGFYELRTRLPEGVVRWVVIDKENGGKADALNAGLNASTSPVFVSMDADSLVDEKAILQAFRVMMNDERVVVIGGQVALANGCIVDDGRVTEVGVPRSHLARFQVVEYIRSFSIGRTALARMNAILIISGVFGVFRRDLVMNVGGYLTRFLTGRLALEYVGEGRETVCEDMEIIVRIQRYIREKNLDQRVAYIPHPVCWTEAPEEVASLAKQRNRWMRGFLESLSFHRTILFNRRYGHLGWFAYPIIVLFELVGTVFELLGYVVVLLSLAAGVLNLEFFLAFLLVSAAYGALVSVSALVTSAWGECLDDSPLSARSLIPFRNRRHVAVLMVYAVLENFGYRQLTLFWRVRGIWDYFRGRTGWDKFERKGFGTAGVAPGETT